MKRIILLAVLFLIFCKVWALPTASISGTIAVCQNSSSPSITFTGANGTKPYTFTYQINGGANQTVSTTGSNSSVTVNAPTSTVGSFVYSLVSVKDNTNATQNQVGSATVTINALPTPTISGTTTVCASSIGNVYSTQSGMTNYIWTVTGGTITSGGGTSNSTVTIDWGSAGTGHVKVNYTNANNCSAASQTDQPITINPLPTATISGTTSVCQNSTSPSITFTGSNGTKPYTFTYQINGGANQTVSTTGSNNSVIVNAPTTTVGSFAYSLVSVQDANCSQNQSGSATVTVNALPTPTISGTVIVCANSIGNIYSTQSGMTNYIWTVTGGTIIAGGSTSNSTVTVDWGIAGTGHVKVNYNNANNCSAASQTDQPITINPLPTATISGTTSVCQNSTSPSITFTGSNGTKPYTFTYQINGGANQTVSTTGSNNSVIVNAPTTTVGSFAYSLVSVLDANCSQNQVGSATVTINALPTATISGTTSVCQNSTSPSITFTGSNGTKPYTFTYQINGGANQTVSTTGSNNSVIVNAPTTTVGSFAYSLVSVQDANCSQNQSGSATVTINPKPNITSVSANNICFGLSTLLTNTTTNYTGTLTYAWSRKTHLDDSTLSSPTFTPSVNPSVNTIYNYKLFVVDLNGCKDTSNNLAIVVHPKPIITSVSNNATCYGTSINLTNSTTNYSTPLTYAWSRKTNLNDSTLSSPTFTAPANPTSNVTYFYTLYVSDINGCKDTSSVNAASVIVHSKPVLLSVIDTAICYGRIANLGKSQILNTSFGSTPFTYSWNDTASQNYFNGYLSNVNDTNPNFNSTHYLHNPQNFDSLYAFKLTVTDNNLCSSNLIQRVKVYRKPVIANTTSTAICYPQTVTLTETVNNTFGTLNYVWSPVSNLSTSTISNPLFTPPSNPTINATYLYTLYVTDGHQCMDTTNSFHAYIRVQHQPSVPNVVAPLSSTNNITSLTLCQNSNNVNFQTDSLPFQSYQWSATGATIINGTNHNYTIVDFDAVNTSATINLTTKIDSTLCSSSNSISITLNTNPDDNCGNIRLKPNQNGLVCLNNNVSKYQWGYDDVLKANIFNGENRQYYDFKSSDDTTKYKYWVQLFDLNSTTCYTKTYYDYRVSCTNVGLNEFQNTNSFFQIFPNPTADILKIQTNEIAKGNVQLSFTDLLGRELLKEQMNAEEVKQIDLSKINEGVY